MSLHNVGYKHWEGSHRSIWYRRWTIATLGLRLFLAGKWNRYFVMVCWLVAFLAVGVLFLLGQLLEPGSFLNSIIETLEGSTPFLFAKALTTWLLDDAANSVSTTYNLFFHYLTAWIMHLFAMVAVIMILPHLITQDLSSRAIIIYSSKAISRLDYLLGKFGTIFGLLCMVWILPVIVIWFMGNLLAPSWSYFWHSKIALFNALATGVFGATVLSLMGMGISAISNRPRSAVGLWIMIWFVGSMIGNAVLAVEDNRARHRGHRAEVYHETPPGGGPRAETGTYSWLRHARLLYNLEEVAKVFFRPGDDIEDFLRLDKFDQLIGLASILHIRRAGEIQDQIDTIIEDDRYRSMFYARHAPGSVVVLGLLVGLSALVLHHRVKPE